jgi:hypothetical protein
MNRCAKRLPVSWLIKRVRAEGGVIGVTEMISKPALRSNAA